MRVLRVLGVTSLAALASFAACGGDSGSGDASSDGGAAATNGRVYAPGVVADLDGDGVKEIGGNVGTVAAYD